MSESPASILVRAADLIRDTAAAAEQQGWRFDDEWGYVRDANGDLVAETSSSEGRWIALMSPAVAPAIEAMLRRAAADIVVYVPAWNSRPRPEGEVDRLIERQFGGALALARAVLGEKEEQ